MTLTQRNPFFHLSEKEGTPTKATGATEMPASDPITTPDEVGMEEKGETLHDQPGLQIGERKIEIKDVGLFRRRTGQPVRLRAYP